MSDAAPVAGLPKLKRRRRWLWLAVPIGLSIAAYLTLTPQQTNVPPLPSPNAYDELGALGRTVRGPVPNQGRIAEADLDALRAWVEANPEIPLRARQSLGRPGRVPLTYTQEDLEAKEIGDLRMLGRMLIARATLDAREGRLDEAADWYLLALELGIEIGRGGLLLHRLAGCATEESAVDGLYAIAPNLDAPTARRVAAMLVELDAGRPLLGATLETERAWRSSAIGPVTRLMFAVSPSSRGMLDKPEQMAIEADNRAVGRAIALAAELAARAYALEHGKLPARLDDLLPDYLPVIPIDPASGRRMIYVPQPDGPAVWFNLSADGAGEARRVADEPVATKQVEAATPPR